MKKLMSIFEDWVAKSLSIHTPKKSRGVVQSTEFTWGAGGHQLTTIDGVVYITYWDAFKKDWKVGDTVDFILYWDHANMGYGRSQVWSKHARDIKKSS